MKGHTDTSFILTLLVFLGFLVLIGSQVSSNWSQMKIVTSLDPVIFTGALIVTAVACATAAGVACATAAGAFTLINVLSSTDYIFSSLIMIPLSLTLAYLFAKLARGGG